MGQPLHAHQAVDRATAGVDSQCAVRPGAKQRYPLVHAGCQAPIKAHLQRAIAPTLGKGRCIEVAIELGSFQFVGVFGGEEHAVHCGIDDPDGCARVEAVGFWVHQRRPAAWVWVALYQGTAVHGATGDGWRRTAFRSLSTSLSVS